MVDYWNVIAEAMTAVNNGAYDDLYHAVMESSRYQFKGHIYTFPDGTQDEVLFEDELHGHGLVHFGSHSVSASVILEEFEFVV